MVSNLIEAHIHLIGIILIISGISITLAIAYYNQDKRRKGK